MRHTLRLLLAPFLAAHLVFPLLWLVILAQYGPRPNDWRQFYLVAHRFVSGAWSDLYSAGVAADHAGYFWRYPPFALYAVAPLAALSEPAAYAVLASTELAALLASLLLLARIASPRHLSTEWALAIVLSAPALTTIIAGQISALLLLCISGAAYLWSRGRPLAACGVLGLLAFKPNVGIFFGYYVLARRNWRGAAAMVATVAALCAVTIPLGLDIWIDFVRVSFSNIDMAAAYEPHKLITLKGFLTVILGRSQMATVAWMAAVIPLLIIAAWAWGVHGTPVRHLSLAALLAIAASPYGFFYDALLLAFPATVWWSERNRWRPAPWTVVGVLIAVAWCWEQAAYNWNEILRMGGIDWLPPFSLIGPIAAVWLVLAAREATRMDSIHREADRFVHSGARENVRDSV
jgi:Glycosyltransferase family 87